MAGAAITQTELQQPQNTRMYIFHVLLAALGTYKWPTISNMSNSSRPVVQFHIATQTLSGNLEH